MPTDVPRVAALATVSLALVGHALAFDFVSDDAFISFRYADNLVRYGELVFNIGERVEGYTNFLWTLMMAGVIKLGLDPVASSKWVGVAFGVATLWVVARFTARTQGPSRWDVLAPALLAGTPAYACWCTGGLETQLFTFFVTLGWTEYLCEREESARRARSGVYFALAAMTRPEGILLFGLTLLHCGFDRWRVGHSALPGRQDWIRGAGFAALFGPFLWWRWTYYGFPLPNTFYAKAGGSALWASGLRYFGGWVVDHHIWVVPLLALSMRSERSDRVRRLHSLAGLYCVVVCLHIIHVGGDFMGLSRFFVPLLPVLAVVAMIGVRQQVETWLANGHRREPLAIGGALAVALFIVNVVRIDSKALEVRNDGGVSSIGWLDAFTLQCTAIGKYLHDVAPAEASIAVTAAGAIPYYSRLRTLDILGLNDEWIAHNVPAHGNRPGHTRRAPLDYVLGHRIDYLIYHPNMGRRPPRQRASMKASWRTLGYTWQTMRVPDLDPPYWGVWVRSRP